MDIKVWFYDHQEYYNYVLLNASQDVCSKVQQTLSLNNIEVLKAAPSFRPASNGIQYKWYIRIEGENFKSPTSEKIKSIVEGVLISGIQILREQPQSQERNNLLTVNIDELQKEINQKNKEIVNAKQLSELELNTLKSNLNTAQSDLEKSNQTVNELSQQIKNSLNLGDVAILENQFKSQIVNIESQLHNAKSQLDNAKSELTDYVSGFQDELNRRDIEIAILIQERNRYVNELQNNKERLVIDERDNSQSLLFSAIHALMPNVEFLRSSLDFAWNNFSNQEIDNIFKALKMMDSPNMRAERVEGTNGWKEYHPDRVDWRIYFRRRKDKQYQVLISDKDTQEKRDFDWLKNQPKNC